MAEEIKESQKFQSGNVYKKDQTDYSAILRQAEQEKTSPATPKPSPKNNPKKNTPKKENHLDKFQAILNAAVARDDEDEEDAFDMPKSEPPKPEKEAKKEEQKVKATEQKTEGKLATKVEKEEPVKVEKAVSEDVKPKPEPEKKEEIKPQEPKVVEQKDNPAPVPVQIQKPAETAPKPEQAPASAPAEDKLETLEELLAKEEEKRKKFEDDGKVIKVADLIRDAESLQEAATLKKRFNPNPPKHLIEGHDFNDPYLDDIYNYTYSEQMAKLRLRKAEERQKKLEAQLEEEKRLEELKSKRQKKKDKKKEKKAEKYYDEPVKPRKQLKIPPNYPKEYVDPTDMEIDEKTGKPYYYFNFTKTVENSKLRFLSKIIPVAAIDDVLYNKAFLDGVADRQHDKCIRLNNMSPEEQYSRDLRNMAIKIAAGALFLFAVFWKITFDIIPDNKYETAIETMDSKDFENAYYQFTELGNKELSVYYAKYSEAKMLFKVGKYQEAKEAFTMLLPFDEDVFRQKGIKIEDEVNECSYQIALNYYYDGDFETAKNIFREIHTYSDATQRYYECGFKIAKDAFEDWQDVADLKKALKYFYRVRKYSTEDIAGYIKQIQDKMYSMAKEGYDNKDYESAIDLYQYLAMFNYTSDDGVNSREMVYQCTYRYGLDLYKNRKYESARKVFAEIPEYKDSYVLSKECMYNIAKILYENNPVASIAEYYKIMGYRDSDYVRNSARLIMYGEWNITEINGSAVTPITFNFYDDGQFKTNKQIISVAISTAARPIYYEWDGEKFAAMEGEYTIIPSYDSESDKMELTCNSPGQQFVYRCVRQKTYEEMIAESEEGNETQTAQETMNQKYQNLINAYIEKKMDHIVTVNGENINIFGTE